MANMRTYNRSFAGGEISPEMYGRIDDAKFQSGAATLRNFIATPTGAAENRAGFAFVKATKNNGVARLINFTYSLNQTMVIELGAGYARFHTMGGTLQYSATQPAFMPVLTGLTVTVANPAVVTWPAHGMNTGDPVGFFFAANPVPPIIAPDGLLDFTRYTIVKVDADHFTLLDPGGNTVAVSSLGVCTINGYRWYVAGDLVSYGGAVYYRNHAEPDGASGSNPSTDPEWTVMPTDLTYEIPTPYAVADLFGIHYVQSADVMTLVHANYPPAELRRLSATTWVLSTIEFGPPLDTPQSVAVAASPGFLAQISSISLADPALITTASNHTLALGDPIYIANLTATVGGVDTVMDGFYLVNGVPVDGMGNLVPNELTVMDYNGNVLDASAWSSYGPTNPGSITIQYGTKIFNIVNNYAVQAIAPDGVNTSALSGQASVLNNLDVPGSFNTITWAGVAGTQSYNVYKQFNGLWGFIGNTQALTFADDNIAPDMGISPGTPDAVFAGTGNYPGAVCYMQQRRWFGGTANAPDNAWGSNSGTESMFSYSLPSQATDRLAFRVAALKADAIQHLVPMSQLIMLTSESEFALGSADGSDVITPTSIDVKPQSYIGASNVQPTIINTSMVYAAARGGHVRELGYAWTVNGFMTGDLSLRAAHLFDNLTIVDQAYAKSPRPIVWFVSSNGKLLGLTYIPEEQLGAWHEHDTQGSFESIACVAEGSEDFLYAVINRTIGGQTVRYVERMASRLFASIQQAFFVDAGATFTATPHAVPADTTLIVSATRRAGPGGGIVDWTNVLVEASEPIFDFPAQTDVGTILLIADPSGNQYRMVLTSTTSTVDATAMMVDPLPAVYTQPSGHSPAISTWVWPNVGVTTISGLTWLEGQTVAVLADGAVQTQKVVTGGSITLDHAASVVNVGLPYTSDLETLPLVLQIDGYGQGRRKNINKVWIRVYQSSGIFAGPDVDHLTEFKQRSTEPYGQPPNLQSAQLEIPAITPMWQDDGQLFIRQLNPLPLSVVGLTMEVAIGG